MAIEFITLALMHTATIYGFGEAYCGEPGKPVPCDSNATTASGEPFAPDMVRAAVPMPANRVMRPSLIWLRAIDGSCIAVKVNDKKNARYIGKGGLDLTPAAVQVLGFTAHRAWSGKVEACSPTDDIFSEKIR